MPFVADSGEFTGAVTSLSCDITATGSNRYALVFVEATGGVTVTSLTYGGNSLSAISGADLNTAFAGVFQLYGLANPPTGLQTVSCTLSGNSARAALYVQVWDGVQSVGNGNATNGEVASSTLSITTSAGDEAVDFCVAVTDGISMAGTGQTNREERDNFGDTFFSFGSASKTATTTSTDLVWDPASSTDVFHVGCRITPVSSGSNLISDTGSFAFSGKEATLTYSNAGGGSATYGRTTIGASWLEFEFARRGLAITLPGTVTASKISAYIRTQGSAANGTRAALYNFSDGSFAYQSDVLAGFTDTVGAWKDYTFTGSVAAGTYWLTIFAEGISGGANTVQIAYDNVTADANLYESWFNDGSVWPTQQADLTGQEHGDGNTQNISLYLTTAGGRSLNAEQGQYTETGVSNAFIYTRKLTSQTGTFSLVGSDAVRDIEIDNEVGAFTVGSGTTNLGVGRMLTPAQGTSFSMAGQGAILFYSAAGPKVLSADSALFNLGLVDVAFRKGVKLLADQGQYQVLGQPVVGGIPPDKGTRAGGVFKIRKALVVSTSGRTKWVHYIPVKQVTPAEINKGTYNNDGAIEVKLLTSSVGLSEWVDYIPVVQVSDIEYERWRTDNSGWIPVIFVE